LARKDLKARYGILPMQSQNHKPEADFRWSLSQGALAAIPRQHEFCVWSCSLGSRPPFGKSPSRRRPTLAGWSVVAPTDHAGREMGIERSAIAQGRLNESRLTLGHWLPQSTDCCESGSRENLFADMTEPSCEWTCDAGGSQQAWSRQLNSLQPSTFIPGSQQGRWTAGQTAAP